MFKQVEISDEILFKYGAEVKTYQKDEYLAHMGGDPKSIIYVYSGAVKIITLNEEGDEYLHGFNYANEIIGIGTYFGGNAYYNDFIAIEEVVTRELSLDNFEKMMMENFEISRSIIKYLSDILELKTLTLTAVLGKSPRDKIIFLLDRIKKYIFKNEQGMVPFTRQELANSLGMRVETVIRTIKELEDEGIVTIEKGKIFY